MCDDNKVLQCQRRWPFDDGKPKRCRSKRIAIYWDDGGVKRCVCLHCGWRWVWGQG